MPRLHRPHIPLDVRLTVALRQLGSPFIPFVVADARRSGLLRVRLSQALRTLFGDEPFHLDHDPALENRPVNTRTGKYKPDANDPEFLIYRTKHDHKIKTLVRGDGAQLSDAAIARKRKRKERKAKRPKHKWPSRPMQSGSKFQKRKKP